MRECVRCQKVFVEQVVRRFDQIERIVQFCFRGVDVRICGLSNKVCSACIEREWIERFEQEGETYIKICDGQIKVDWKLIEERWSQDLELGRKIFWGFLRDLGVLTKEARGHFILCVFSDGAFPRDDRLWPSDYLYFTKHEDAVAYAKEAYKDKDWKVWQVMMGG